MDRPGRLETVAIVAWLATQEAVRRRAVLALGGLSVVLMGLFALAAWQAVDPDDPDVDVIGATLLGTAAFSTLLLGAIVAVFLTHSAVRGDAERGLLQPVLVRPVQRWSAVAGRATAGVVIAASYAFALWLVSVGLLRVVGGWAPERWLAPGAAVALAVALVAVASVAASSMFGAMVAGSFTLVLVGLGFTVGLLAQLGDTLDIALLVGVADVVSLVLPFEALYRHALAVLGAGLVDLPAGAAVGPFGGAREAGPLLLPWIGIWTLAALGLASLRATRMDV
jgi:Cu-processing system permease protein